MTETTETELRERFKACELASQELAILRQRTDAKKEELKMIVGDATLAIITARNDDRLSEVKADVTFCRFLLNLCEAVQGILKD